MLPVFRPRPMAGGFYFCYYYTIPYLSFIFVPNSLR